MADSVRPVQHGEATDASLGLLDPASSDADERDRAAQWIALQQAFVYRPEACSSPLRSGVPPEIVLHAAGVGSDSGPGAATERDLDALARTGARVLPLTAAGYPERLRRLDDAPPALLVQSDASWLARPAVSIVGARAATAYGRAVAARLAAAAAGAGIVVVSGLANGIDGVAHAAALDAGGATLAVQGCGPDVLYPRGHRGLAGRIRERGALLTEFPVGMAPLPHHFPLRNRVISALARLVVIVEARERSGSLVTARHAANQGVDVGAVPGPIDAPTSRATNRLLREGARVIAGEADLLEELGVADSSLEPAPEAGHATTPEQRVVLRLLAESPRSRDEILRASGLTPDACTLALVELELAGRLAEDRDGRLRRVR